MIQADDVERGWGHLCEYTEQVRRATGVPGIAIAVVSLAPRSGSEAFVRTEGFGVRRIGEAALVDADTVFPLASLSKPIASTVMATLVRDDVIRWWQEVPDLDLVNRPSYAQLFAHRSGLPAHAGDLLEDIGFDRATILRRLGALALDRLGSYAYTNFGLTAAAVRAAERAGKLWEDVACDNLYTPLGMHATSSRFAEFEARVNRTWGHRRRADGTWYHDVQRNPDAQTPAGGVTSSARDLVAWIRLQLGDRSLGFDERFFACLADTHRHYADDGRYGLGWNVAIADGEVASLSHSGAFELGAATCVKICPEDQLGIVVLTNGEPIALPETIARAFQLLLGDREQTAAKLLHEPIDEPPGLNLGGPLLANYAQAMGAVLHPPPRSSDAAEPDKVIDAGEPLFNCKYTSAFYGTIEFAVEQGALVMLQGPDERRERFVLTPTASELVFVYDSRGEMGATGNRVAFARGDAGAPDRVTVWNLFVSHPQQLSPGKNTRCALPGTIRVWSVTARRPGRVALTVCSDGVDGFRTGPTMEVVAGSNSFVGADLEVRAGDCVGIVTDDRVYWQMSTDDYAVGFEIDREGTFTRAR